MVVDPSPEGPGNRQECARQNSDAGAELEAPSDTFVGASARLKSEGSGADSPAQCTNTVCLSKNTSTTSLWRCKISRISLATVLHMDPAAGNEYAVATRLRFF